MKKTLAVMGTEEMETFMLKVQNDEENFCQ